MRCDRLSTIGLLIARAVKFCNLIGFARGLLIQQEPLNSHQGGRTWSRDYVTFTDKQYSIPTYYAGIVYERRYAWHVNGRAGRSDGLSSPVSFSRGSDARHLAVG